ncbi:organic cation transporter protein [Prorops nasuta]|uniref:organic cation transporter protein n=1 Tax=Prorops nasuta TaxID=863751 RepID=UPI0034CD612D
MKKLEGTNEELEEKPKDHLLEALQKLGKGSGFLYMIFFFTVTPLLLNGMTTMSQIFIAAVPGHWCSVPELRKANWTDEQIRNISSVGSCSKYNYDYEYLARIGFEAAVEFKRTHELPATSNCPVRDFANDIDGTSYVKEWDLVCDKIAYRSNVQMALSLGKLIGSFFGAFGDKYGRKIMYRIGLVLLLVSGPTSSIVPWYWGFMLLRLIAGISYMVVGYSAFTILTEVAEERYRQWLGIAFNAGYALGIAILGGVAYALRDWRYIVASTTVPAVFLILNVWLMPESPRWLISQNRRKEARKIIEQFYGPITEDEVGKQPISTNGESNAEGQYDLSKNKEIDPIKNRFRENWKNFKSLYTHSELFKRILIVYFLWMTTSFSYYALALNVQNFSTNRYYYVVIMGLTEIPAYLLATPLLMVMGRRQATTMLYSIGALCLLGILALPSTKTLAIVSICLIGRFALSIVFGIIILYTSELFPTVARSSAIGTSSSIAHTGSILAPYVADLLGAIAWYSTTTVCGIMAFLAGILCLLLPETRGRALADSIEEAVTKKRGRVSLRNCYSCN